MIGNLDLARQVLGAGHLVGEHGRQEILRVHPRDLRRNFLAAAEPRQRERDGGIPAPAHAEHGRGAERLHQQRPDGFRVQEARRVRQFETMRVRQRQHDVILGRRRLQFEIERAAKALAQRQAPGAVHAAAVRGMNDQLHPARLIEEALENDGVQRRQALQRGPPGGEILGELRRRGLIEAHRLPQPARGGVRSGVEPRGDLGAQARHRGGQFVGAARRLAQPEGNGRRLSVGVLDAHRAALDAQYPVRCVAQLEHVALQAFDGEVLVDGADRHSLGLEHDLVVGVVRNRAAGHDGGEARALVRPQRPGHRIAVNERTPAAAPRAEALGQHAHAIVEVLAAEAPIRVGAADQGEQRLLRAFPRGDLGGDLLGEHVQCVAGDGEAVQLPAPHGIEQRRALDQFVARQWEQSALGRAAHRVPGAPDPLQEAVDRAGRPDLAHQVDVADVEPEFQRRGRHQHLQVAALQPLFRVEAPFLGEAAVMSRHLGLAQPFGQVARHPLGQPARVDEHQRGAMFLGELRDPVVDLRPGVARHDRLERRCRQFQREIPIAAMSAVDDDAVARARIRAAQESRDLLDGRLRRGQSDARQSVPRNRLQALERQRQMSAALVGGDCVDFIDDDGPAGGEHGPSRFGAQQHVQRFRGGHDDVRRLPPHARALGSAAVAGAHDGAYRHVGEAESGQLAANACQWRFEVAVDVVRQGLQGRDIEHPRLIREDAGRAVPDQLIDRREEGREGLAGAGGRGHQHVPSRLDGGPRVGLRPRRRLVGSREPRGDGGMKGFECAHDRDARPRTEIGPWIIGDRGPERRPAAKA